jgi:type IV secretory pathway VirJ component
VRNGPSWRRRAGLALLPLAAAYCASPCLAADERVHFGMFGDLHLARPKAAPTDVVLLLSDTDGWTPRSQLLADTLADSGALAVGIDLPVYRARLDALGEACAYPAGHVEELAHWIERHAGLVDYRTPLVVGDGAGANMGYALVAQAPAGTFGGLITLGWDWDLAFARPFCPGDAGSVSAADAHGGYRVAPLGSLPSPWLAQPFAPGTRSSGPAAGIGLAWQLATLLLPTLDEGTARADLTAAFATWSRRDHGAAAPLSGDIADLPLTEIEPRAADTGRIVLLLTGDGGWAGLDKGVAEVLAGEGSRVVGFSTLRFFWEARTPEQTVDAVRRTLAHYAQRYPQSRFAIVGYSFGASLVPYVINHLPLPLQQRIDGATMISPDDEAVFEIRIGDWFGGAHHDGALPVRPEIARSALPLTCIHGAEETDSFCAGLEDPKLDGRTLAGGHHYDGDYAALGRAIVEGLARPR